RAAVRVAAGDDVRARRRRQDEPQGDAESAAARGHRSCPFRHGAAPAAAGVATACRSRARRTPRAAARLRPDLRAAGGHTRAAGGLAMKRRFYFILVVLALVLLAIPGFAAKAAKRARPAHRFA